jgi:hypothetical protein
MLMYLLRRSRLLTKLAWTLSDLFGRVTEKNVLGNHLALAADFRCPLCQ